jgi:outer membrane protein assembly factor BamA
MPSRAAAAVRGVVAAAALAAAPLPALAQDPDPWRSAWLVYPAYNTLERLSANGVIAWRKPPRPTPPPLTASIEVQGKIATSGSRSLVALFDAPGYWRRWRLLAMAGAERQVRAPYYGLGNDTELSDSAEAANGDAHYYRYILLRSTVFVAAQRSLGGPWRAHAGLQWRHYRSRPAAAGPTRLAEDLAAGVVRDTGSRDGLEARAGLLFDTRDEEGSPARGVLLEAVVARGLRALGGEHAYTRWLLGARGFLPLGELTTLASRVRVELADRPLPFVVAYERVTSWRPEDGFGGATTLRANLPGRWLAPNHFLASADLRYKKIDIPFPRTPIRLWLLGFADVGLVWLDGERPDFGSLHGGLGVGARLQYSKSGMFGLDLGWSPDSRFEFGTAFQFAY